MTTDSTTSSVDGIFDFSFTPCAVSTIIEYEVHPKKEMCVDKYVFVGFVIF